jgi:hypothetical protein
MTGSTATVGFNPTLDTGWHTLIVTYDGVSATSTGSYAIYWDGALQTIATGSGITNDTNGRIGACSLGQFFDGEIKDIVVYDSVLSGGDISLLNTYLSSL